jgi:hypothetical protein
MNEKFSYKVQKEIDELLSRLNEWKKFFSIDLNYFYEGWGLYLREKVSYPRLIVVFKSYRDTTFSLSSFEIHFSKENKEKFRKLYLKDKIPNINELISEFKKVLYGKDIISSLKYEYKLIS